MPEFDLEDRVATSPLVERIWRGRSEGGGAFISRAASQWETRIERGPGCPSSRRQHG